MTSACKSNFYYFHLKNKIDFCLTIVMIFFACPVFIITGLLVYLKIGSPILFKQKRPGMHGVPFTMYKFRTMTDKRDALGNLLPDSFRLTQFGQFMRKSSLDEFPEFFNVLKGDMSLIGPRPLLMQYLERYSPEQMRRHDVKPGITGLAQISGRNDLSWEKKFILDLLYIDNLSFKLDFKIFAKTFKKVFKPEGINQPGVSTVNEFMGINADG